MTVSLLVLGYPNMQFSDYESMLTRQKEKIDFSFGINTNGSIEYTDYEGKDHIIIGFMGYEPTFVQCGSLGTLVKEFIKTKPVFQPLAATINNTVYKVEDFPSLMYAMIDKFIDMGNTIGEDELIESDSKLFTLDLDGSEELAELLKNWIGSPLSEEQILDLYTSVSTLIIDGVISFEYLPNDIVKVTMNNLTDVELDELDPEVAVESETKIDTDLSEPPKRKGRPKKNG